MSDSDGGGEAAAGGAGGVRGVRRERPDGEGGASSDVTPCHTHLLVDAGGDVETEGGKKRGRRVLTVLNAPKGNARQLFAEYTGELAKPDYLACVMCQLRHPNEPKKFLFSMGQGSTNAWKHLAAVHGIGEVKNVDKQQTTLGGPRVQPEDANDAFFREMILELRPFRFLEGPGRRHSQAITAPNVNLPSKDWLRRRLEKEYEFLRGQFQRCLQNPAFCLYYNVMFDGWTISGRGRLLYALRVSFLTEDFEYVVIPIEISTIGGKDSSIVAQWIQRALQGIGLDFERCLVMTADGAEKKVICPPTFRFFFSNALSRRCKLRETKTLLERRSFR